MELSTLFGICLVFMFAGEFVQSYPNGAPPSVCDSMAPGHNVNSQSGTPRNNGIQLSATTYDGSSPIQVTLQGSMMGLMLQARKQGDMKPIGTFSSLPAGTKILACSGAVNSLTHSDKNLKNNIVVMWTPPSVDVGSIVFYATIVQSYGVFWVNVPSQSITFQMAGQTNPGTNINTNTNTVSVSNNTMAATTTPANKPTTSNTEQYVPNAVPENTGRTNMPCQVLVFAAVFNIMFNLLR